MVLRFYSTVNAVKEMVMVGDAKREMTVFQYGSIKWNLIVPDECI
ncbi:MAG: hypothetical protein U5J96_18585 [Ignavibacteriaceae bacterium]|nr:hypothetical protein [Ignavibacteriaceae bacterium]